jgi:hypothetical protein
MELLCPQLADEALAVVKAWPPERERAIIFAYALNPDHLVIDRFKAGYGHSDLGSILRSKGHRLSDVHSSTILWRAGEESEIAQRNEGVLNMLPEHVRAMLMSEINKRVGP